MSLSPEPVILVRVGRVLGTFGVHGHLKCAYTTDHPELIATRRQYLLVEPRSGECRQVSPVEVELRQGEFLIRLAGFDAPEPLKRFAGWELRYPARRGELPRAEGEVYFFELPGLEVRTPSGEVLGVVSEVRETGAHVVLEIDRLPSRQLPFTRQHVPEVNLEEGYLITTYPLDGWEEAR